MLPRRKKSKCVELSSQCIAKLMKIYETNNWPINSAFGDSEFDVFCNMLSYLNHEQQHLILELTEKFLKVDISHYLNYFIQAIDKLMHSTVVEDKKRIFIFPLLRESDVGKIKSSFALYYIIKSHCNDLQKKYSDYSICLFDTIDFFDSPSFKFGEQDLFCPVDDFIGTGETAVDATNLLIKHGIGSNDIAVIALVSQDIGARILESKGCHLFVATYRNRGISDSGHECENKFEIMDSIEDILNVNEKYRRGYGQSEALVKMVRTPNNTFPIYWYAQNKTIPHIPFPR